MTGLSQEATLLSEDVCTEKTEHFFHYLMNQVPYRENIRSNQIRRDIYSKNSCKCILNYLNVSMQQQTLYLVNVMSVLSLFFANRYVVSLIKAETFACWMVFIN